MSRESFSEIISTDHADCGNKLQFCLSTDVTTFVINIWIVPGNDYY